MYYLLIDLILLCWCERKVSMDFSIFMVVIPMQGHFDYPMAVKRKNAICRNTGNRS